MELSKNILGSDRVQRGSSGSSLKENFRLAEKRISAYSKTSLTGAAGGGFITLMFCIIPLSHDLGYDSDRRIRQ
jgi:hypothetical protein